MSSAVALTHFSLVFLLPLSGADDPDAVFRKRVDERPLLAFELSDADITFLAIPILAKAARQTDQAMRGHVPEVNAVNADDFLTLVLVPLEFHDTSIFKPHASCDQMKAQFVYTSCILSTPVSTAP